MMNRREFLEFFGRSTLGLALTSTSASLLYSACSTGKSRIPLPFKPLKPSYQDELMLAPGLQPQLLISWNEVLNTKGDRFGFNNDYTAFIPLNPHYTDAILWVNHEYPHPLFVSGYDGKKQRTKEQVIQEQLACGGTLLRIRKNAQSQWEWVYNDPYNQRLTAQTRIPLISDRPIKGKTIAIGTFANCAGGVTPWGTILTCEENYDEFYQDGKNLCRYHWEEFFDYPVEHYGWVVEVEPKTAKAHKLTALGRFAHEGATLTLASDGRAVVYMGDDRNDECIYKFIAKHKNSLKQGTLFVANTEKGRWVPLQMDNPILAPHFTDQTDLLIHTRKAAQLAGGTPQDRPEDIEIDPHSKDIFVALTNNKKQSRFHGSILRIREKNKDPLSLEFEASTFLPGGSESGFSCPDNLAFDPSGNLWMTSDIASDSLGKNEYKNFGNNSLFYIPMSGVHAGKVLRIASGPIQSELTGITFTPDGKSLFLSVQHPGEDTQSLDNIMSHWPEGGNSVPKPSVVVIEGPLLTQLTQNR